MNILEWFCGTKSFSKAAKKRGHEIWTLDFDPQFKPDQCIDILDCEYQSPYPSVDVIWASPPCDCFSVASIGRHWNKDKTPKTDKARHALEIVKKTISLIKEVKPRFFFIENPRGMMRTLPILTQFKRNTVTYCQYGERRMKPTDIWTNCDIRLRPPCKNGSPCHDAAPRGARTGTQGIKGSISRGVVPESLCDDILEYCEKDVCRQTS